MKCTLRGTFGSVEVDVTYGKLTDVFVIETPAGVFTLDGNSVRGLALTVEVLEKDAKTKK